MIYAWGILALLAAFAGVILLVGWRSRAHQDEYMAAPDEMSGPSPQRLRAERIMAGLEVAEPVVQEPPEAIREALPEAIVKPSEITATRPTPRAEDFERVTGAGQIESGYDEAELMLREVKAMLLQGRPDRAIAHIRSATGVDHYHAAEFVADVEARVIG